MILPAGTGKALEEFHCIKTHSSSRFHPLFLIFGKGFVSKSLNTPRGKLPLLFSDSKVGSFASSLI